MSILTGALSAGRAMAESRMTDSCVVTRENGSTWDEATGQYVSATTTIYAGVCRIAHTSTMPADVDAGSALIAVGQLELHVPTDTPVFAPDDVAVITASATRADQVGRTFVIAAPFDGSQTTALRYKVEVADAR